MSITRTDPVTEDGAIKRAHSAKGKGAKSDQSQNQAKNGPLQTSVDGFAMHQA